MWTVVFLAQKQSIAASLREALEKEGVLVRVRACGEGNSGFEVLVPQTEVTQAHDIILETGF